MYGEECVGPETSRMGAFSYLLIGGGYFIIKKNIFKISIDSQEMQKS